MIKMLITASCFVLASFRPSTYPRGYASALHSLRPCRRAFLIILRNNSPTRHLQIILMFKLLAT
jgi:hypothetical protein